MGCDKNSLIIKIHRNNNRNAMERRTTRGAKPRGRGEGRAEGERTAETKRTRRSRAAPLPSCNCPPAIYWSWCHVVWNEPAVGQAGSAAPAMAPPLPDPPPRGRAREAGKAAAPPQ